MTVTVITEQAALDGFCASLRQAEFAAVDTEFLRETTYWPKLCLIQAACEGAEAVIDPLAKGLDLKPFWDFLADESVLKVFHAARQDLEIFLHDGGVIPKPLYDTQIAAMVCGFGDAVSYENLMRQLIGAQVDKSSRFTDWSRRPLSDKQLAYALSDVTLLREAFAILQKRVVSQKREAWVAEELAPLTRAETYDNDPANAWRRLKLRAPKPRKLAVAMELAAWREEEAQARDTPRGRILKDDALIDIAQNAPRTREELGRLRGAPKGFENSKYAEPVLKAIARGLERPREGLPMIEDAAQTPKSAAPLIDLFKVVLRAQSERHGVAAKMIANVADLERMATEDEPDVAALKGWRRRVFGEAAMAVKRGDMALAVEDGDVRLVALDRTSCANGFRSD